MPPSTVLTDFADSAMALSNFFWRRLSWELE